MKKFFVFLSLLSLLTTSISVGFGQGRPRRVGNSSQTGISQSESTAPTPPSRPPVLGGANYPNNRQHEPQQEQQPTGPEEETSAAGSRPSRSR